MIWTPGTTLAQVEKKVIEAALAYYNGNKTHVAKALGVSIRTIRNKINEYGLLQFKGCVGDQARWGDKKWKTQKF